MTWGILCSKSKSILKTLLKISLISLSNRMIHRTTPSDSVFPSVTTFGANQLQVCFFQLRRKTRALWKSICPCICYMYPKYPKIPCQWWYGHTIYVSRDHYVVVIFPLSESPRSISRACLAQSSWGFHHMGPTGKFGKSSTQNCGGDMLVPKNYISFENSCILHKNICI